MDLIQYSSSNKTKYSMVLIVAIIMALSFTSILDTTNDQYFDKALKQAAASFTISKTLNAIVSVAQDVDMTAEPLGFGASVGLGEVLDPINDMIEKFSNVMFISTLSLGVQKILSEVGRCIFIKAIIGLTAVMIILYLMIDNIPARESGGIIFTKIFFIFVVLRFAMPVVSIINNQIYDSITQTSLQIEADKITILTDEISNLDFSNNLDYYMKTDEGDNQTENQSKSTPSSEEDENPSGDESGFMKSVGEMLYSASGKTGDAYHTATDSMSKKWNNLKKKVDPKKFKASIDALQKKVSGTSTYLVNLAIIFVFQTIVSPLIVLWGIMKMARYLIGSRS